jgi:hypothetical protein
LKTKKPAFSTQSELLKKAKAGGFFSIPLKWNTMSEGKASGCQLL